MIKSWRNNRERLSHFFKYPEEIRRIIYTTNTIEAVHRQFRKLTKTKGAFPNQDSLLKFFVYGNPECQQEVDYAGSELVTDYLSAGHIL